MKNHREEWQRQSQYDLETAEAMYDSARYLYAVFMAHLAVEKALKGLYHERKGEAPPKIHNLVRLAQLIELSVPPEYQQIFLELTTAQIDSRYPETLDLAEQQFTKKAVREMMNRAKKVLQWINDQP